MTARASISPDPPRQHRARPVRGSRSRRRRAPAPSRRRTGRPGRSPAGSGRTPLEPLREAQVVLDRGALAGLAAGRLALDDDRAQALGGGVHGRGEPGRSAADDADVVQRLLRPGPQARAARPGRGSWARAASRRRGPGRAGGRPARRARARRADRPRRRARRRATGRARGCGRGSSSPRGCGPTSGARRRGRRWCGRGARAASRRAGRRPPGRAAPPAGPTA